jgi:benzoyl-CoA reductase/2-hydroxyglutaryl-CoA dehydratase subunit BcrC/BadD/HgdB
MKVYLTSPWVPPEWIQAYQLEPCGIWTQEAALEVVPAAGVCAYAEMVVRWAEKETPAPFVFTTHCDQLRRSFDALSRAAGSRAFLFNLPVTQGTVAARTLFQDELDRLGRWLKAWSGKPPTAEVLGQVLREGERGRQRLREAAERCPARPFAEAVRHFHRTGQVDEAMLAHGWPHCRSLVPQNQGKSDPIRLALVGGPFTVPFWPLFDEIEKAGGTVVLNATESGERSLGAEVSSAGEAWRQSPQPEEAGRYFSERIVDMFQRPNDRFYTWLMPRVTARKVQGIVLWLYYGCDLWRAEWATLREQLHLPVLLLEADETGSGFERAKIRLQAFLESLSIS